MPGKTTEDILRAIVVQQLGVEPEQVIKAARFDKDLGADSLDAIEIQMAVEEDFNIEIADEDFAETGTFGAFVALVTKKAERAARRTIAT